MKHLTLAALCTVISICPLILSVGKASADEWLNREINLQQRLDPASVQPPSVQPLNQQSIRPTIVAERLSTIPVSDVEVRGRIVRIEGRQVELRRENGDLASYTIPEYDQRRFGLAVGSDVALAVRASDQLVTAIRNVSDLSAPGNTARIPLADVEVYGRIVKIEGEQVELRRGDGELASYTIPEYDQRRFGLAVGSDVALAVRTSDRLVTAIRNVSDPSAPGNTARIPVTDVEVYGRIVKIEGENVHLKRGDGEMASYTISEADQRRLGLAIGSQVALTVRAADNAVITINSVKSDE